MLPGAPLTVLCVDDDPDILLLLRTKIDREPDFELVAATTDATAALELVGAHRPDVLIFDHLLRGPSRAAPGHARRPAAESGLDLLAGARVITPDTVIVMFTGLDGIADSALDAGADVCITKPDMDALWPATRRQRSST